VKKIKMDTYRPGEVEGKADWMVEVDLAQSSRLASGQAVRLQLELLEHHALMMDVGLLMLVA